MAAEPTTSAGIAYSFTGGLVAAFGPVLGPWLTVLLAAFVGAMWAVGRVETASKIDAAWLLTKIVLTALVLTAALAAFLMSQFSWTAEHVLPLAAFAIGALGDQFKRLKEAVTERLVKLIGGAQ